MKTRAAADRQIIRDRSPYQAAPAGNSHGRTGSANLGDKITTSGDGNLLLIRPGPIRILSAAHLHECRVGGEAPGILIGVTAGSDVIIHDPSHTCTRRL